MNSFTGNVLLSVNIGSRGKTEDSFAMSGVPKSQSSGEGSLESMNHLENSLPLDTNEAGCISSIQLA